MWQSQSSHCETIRGEHLQLPTPTRWPQIQAYFLEISLTSAKTDEKMTKAKWTLCEKKNNNLHHTSILHYPLVRRKDTLPHRSHLKTIRKDKDLKRRKTFSFFSAFKDKTLLMRTLQTVSTSNANAWRTFGHYLVNYYKLSWTWSTPWSQIQVPVLSS